ASNRNGRTPRAGIRRIRRSRPEAECPEGWRGSLGEKRRAKRESRNGTAACAKARTRRFNLAGESYPNFALDPRLCAEELQITLDLGRIAGPRLRIESELDRRPANGIGHRADERNRV